MILEKNPRPNPINYNIKYNPALNDKEFLKILHQKKKRMVYIGKI